MPGPPFRPPAEARLTDEQLKELKNRDGEANRKVVRWILRTAKSYFKGIVLLMCISIAGSVLGIVFALLSQTTIDSAVSGQIPSLVLFSVLLALVGLGQIAVQALSNYATERVSAKVENGYRSRLFNYILDRDYSQISAFHSGELMNRMTDDVDIIVSGVTSFLPTVAQIVANLVGAGGVLLLMDWRFSLIYVVATIVLIAVNRIFRHAIKHLSKRRREADGAVRSYYQEAIESLVVLRVFVTQKRAKEKSEQLLRCFYDTRLEANKVRIKSSAAIGLSMNFGHLFALIWCSFQLVNGSMGYGTMMAIMQLTGQVRMPFISASNLSSQYYYTIASGERLMAIEELAPESSEEELAEADFDARELYQSLERIELRDLRFGYGREQVLGGVNADIERGSIVAIMGQSGCGKSTLFKLMLGMYRNYEGSMRLVGTNPDGSTWERDLGPQTRRLFAYVPQGNLLISGKLRDNLAFADHGLTDADIWEACRLACADEFLRKLPDGLNTVIGEHGAGLSEGQTQRIAVARALLSGAPILLLDEATSALDQETEARMLKNIRQLRNRSCLIVTHREAALAICDKKLVLTDGVLGDGESNEKASRDLRLA